MSRWRERKRDEIRQTFQQSTDSVKAKNSHRRRKLSRVNHAKSCRNYRYVYHWDENNNSDTLARCIMPRHALDSCQRRLNVSETTDFRRPIGIVRKHLSMCPGKSWSLFPWSRAMPREGSDRIGSGNCSSQRLFEPNTVSGVREREKRKERKEQLFSCWPLN